MLKITAVEYDGTALGGERSQGIVLSAKQLSPCTISYG